MQILDDMWTVTGHPQQQAASAGGAGGAPAAPGSSSGGATTGAVDTFLELQQSVVCSTYAACKRRVLLFDFGGTLVERERIGKYHKRDMNATTGRKPTARVFEALATLAADPRNTVFVITGMTRPNLEHTLGHIGALGLAA